MEIKDTLNFFMNLKSNSIEKSEIKLYDKYIGILLDLKNRNLTQNQIQTIESELETLNLKTESVNRNKYLSQKLPEFKKFLKDKFNLVSEGYYAGIGTGNGIVLGSIFSLLLYYVLGIYAMLIGVVGGMLLGSFLGGIRDSKAKEQGRVLITKPE